MVNKLFFSSLICLFIISCLTIKTKKLTYKNTFHLASDIIHTNGFYYHNYIPNIPSRDNIIYIIVFFQNGYVFQAGYSSIEAAKTALMEPNTYNFRYGWGVYRIDNDTVKIQTFVSSGGGPTPVWDVIEDRGIIKSPELITINLSIFGTKQNIESKRYEFITSKIASDGNNWLMK